MHSPHTGPRSSDANGAPTSATGDALQLINTFIDGYLGYRPSAASIVQRANEFPEVGLVNICAGMLMMLGEHSAAPQLALPYLELANRATGLHRREQALLDLLTAWQRHDHDTAASVAEAIVAEWPQDLLTLKLVHYHRFGLGDYPAMLRASQQAGLQHEDNRDSAAFCSMMAFSHEQCHQIDAAEQWAMAGLAINPDEPWSHHAMAHVDLTRGKSELGRERLLAVAPTWDGLNSFMFTHNWWHLALFEIATEGRLESAVTIYDQRCWGVEPTYSQDQIGAVSLLTFLGFAGVDTSARWAALRPHLETRVDDVANPFLSLQYLYGLAKSGSPLAEDLLINLRRQATDDRRWRTIAGPAAEGVYAHACGDHRAAVDHLGPVMGRLWQIGGSHAQRDLFAQILLDAQIRAEQWTAAQQTVQLRHNWMPDHPVTNLQRSAINAALGLTDW